MSPTKQWIYPARDSYNILVGLCSAGAIAYTVNLIRTPKNWELNSTDEAATLNRGKFTSVFAMLTLGIFNMILDKYAGINGYTSAATMSILAGNLTGYVMDASLAGPDGWNKSKGSASVLSANLSDCFKHGFASLLSYNAIRYTLTVLFDMHISSVFIEGIGKMTLFNKIAKTDPWKSFLPTFFATIVSLTTFYAYTNETRFRFAIRKPTDSESSSDSSSDSSEGGSIDTFTMFALVSIASVVYLHIKVDGDQGIHNPNMKALNVIVTFMIMAVMTQFNAVEKSAPVNPDRWVWGFATFASLVAGLVVATFQTSPSWTSEDEKHLKTQTNEKGETEFVPYTYARLWVKYLMIAMVLATILVPFAMLCTWGSGRGAFFVFVALLVVSTVIFNIKGNAFTKEENFFRTPDKVTMEGGSNTVKMIGDLLKTLLKIVLAPYFVVARALCL